ncbi:ATP-dependent Clp protease proteolytic subunit-related protein 4, chloroplastic isoform X2 [Elaeis guineensis]|uniref:ATP-dependent Clp protease proteolytic subunit-related protein 4, chloroplastic isoform X2 n=1 Tax=Elaeis guineensis var. tenera TaxID=51953 RepID=UPI00094FE670
MDQPRSTRIKPRGALDPSASSVPPRTPLATSFVALFLGPNTRCPILSPSLSGSGSKRCVAAMVIPFLKGSAWEQPPPDLPSYLYKNRIVYLGISLTPSVTELILAEFLYLQYEDAEKPIHLYINSTGTTKGDKKLGYETEAFAIHDIMRYVNPPVFTLCVGNAWGEVALLLAAGARGHRAALPSSTIMIKQPARRYCGQATDTDLARIALNNVKAELVFLYSSYIGKPPVQIEKDTRRPKYFSPGEAVGYGVIDKVLVTAYLKPFPASHNKTIIQTAQFLQVLYNERD